MKIFFKIFCLLHWIKVSLRVNSLGQDGSVTNGFMIGILLFCFSSFLVSFFSSKYFVVAAAAAKMAASVGFSMLQHDILLVAAGDLIIKVSLSIARRLEFELALLVRSLVDNFSDLAFNIFSSFSSSHSVTSISTISFSRLSFRMASLKIGEGGSTITFICGNLPVERGFSILFYTTKAASSMSSISNLTRVYYW